MMTVTEARKAMMEFVNKYKGKTVLFAKLNDKERLIYVMVDSFSFYTFLKGAERVQRAIDNAYAHKRSGFEFHLAYPTMSMHISKT